METPEQDSRLEFIGNYVQKVLKLKSEKWSRLLSVMEYRCIVFEFLDNPEISVLVISQVIKLVHIFLLINCIISDTNFVM